MTQVALPPPSDFLLACQAAWLLQAPTDAMLLTANNFRLASTPFPNFSMIALTAGTGKVNSIAAHQGLGVRGGAPRQRSQQKGATEQRENGA